MANIEIYTLSTCPWCKKAKALLRQKKVSFKEIVIDNNSHNREEMIKRSGRTTTPQIFINGKHIGGYNDIYELDKRGGLDPLLK